MSPDNRILAVAGSLSEERYLDSLVGKLNSVNLDLPASARKELLRGRISRNTWGAGENGVRISSFDAKTGFTIVSFDYDEGGFDQDWSQSHEKVFRFPDLRTDYKYWALRYIHPLTHREMKAYLAEEKTWGLNRLGKRIGRTSLLRKVATYTPSKKGMFELRDVRRPALFIEQREYLPFNEETMKVREPAPWVLFFRDFHFREQLINYTRGNGNIMYLGLIKETTIYGRSLLALPNKIELPVHLGYADIAYF